MTASAQPSSVDLSAFPDLTVVYLGMQVTRLRGIATVLGFGRPLAAIGRDKPDGLLHQEFFLWALDHVGFRQYWRDFDSLERFTKADPHRAWWRDFLRDARGTGFWHETYRRNGGMEAVYIGTKTDPGFAAFAPHIARDGAHATARRRIEMTADA